MPTTTTGPQTAHTRRWYQPGDDESEFCEDCGVELSDDERAAGVELVCRECETESALRRWVAA